MSELLQALALGPHSARNRIVFGPHETNLARKRSVSERHVAYYRRRAIGGAGVIVVEEASVHRSDWPYERCPLANESVDGWHAVARACNDEGALVVVALGHSGGQGSSAYSQSALWAPSRVPEVATREVPKQMEPEDIAEVVEGFSDAAALAIDAGVHGIEVNAGQYSLLRQFLSGLTNMREDEWGADRSMLVRSVLRAVRDGAPGAALGLRLSCDELAPWAGIVPEEGARIAAELAPLVDYVTVVRGSIFTTSATRPDTHTGPGFNAQLAALVKDAIGDDEAAPHTKVVAQGSIVDPEMAEQMLRDGRADAVEMTRAQIADPDLANKVEGGEKSRVRPCILCNEWCQVRDARNPIVSCVGEPASGHEWEAEWNEPVRVANPERRSVEEITIVGGGPAGLECARVCAEAGLRVTVTEREPSLGGAIRVASSAPGRARLSALADWLESECRELGVTIRAGDEVDPDSARELSSDGRALVICTGSRPGRQLYETSAGAIVLRPGDVLEQRADLSGDAIVLVWDPVGGPVGISVAETLSGAGTKVVLVTPDLVVGQQLAKSGDLAPANVRLQSAGVELRRRSLLRKVEKGAALVEDRFSGETESLQIAAVVDAGHLLPEDGLFEVSGRRALRAGDAVAPRGIGEAVLEGRRVAMSVARGAISDTVVGT